MKPATKCIYPFSEAEKYLKESDIGSYIFGYMDFLSAKTVLIEKDYIDKDYIIDYSFFYSRSFKDIPRKTERIHFFLKIFQMKNF